jgi:hypothetical protein
VVLAARDEGGSESLLLPIDIDRSPDAEWPIGDAALPGRGAMTHQYRRTRRAARLPRAIATLCATLAIGCWSITSASAQRSPFRIEEATIADVHRAIMARQLTVTALVNEYFKRIALYNGACVKGAPDPATGFQLGDIAQRYSIATLRPSTKPVSLNPLRKAARLSARAPDPGSAECPPES